MRVARPLGDQLSAPFLTNRPQKPPIVYTLLIQQPSPPDLANRQVGRYRVVSLLGRGGMGAVYRAVDTSLERQVALKILPPDLVTHSDRLQRFIQEAKTASALNHPHLVAVYEVGSDVIGGDTIHYMAMELVEGESLRERIGGRALDLKRALTIMSQVADAVAAAHSAGITHRDLKPDNIMVSTAGYAKVLDFGLAKLRVREDDGSRTAVRGTDPGIVMGTAGYMSPEQAQGRDADARSDVFSLGCILYELATGHRAFEGSSTVDTLHKIINAPPAKLAESAPHAPLELQRIVGKALEKDPEDRYQSVKDLAIDLRRLLRELESNPDLVTVSTPSGPHAAVQPRRRAFTMVLAAVAVAALAVIAVLLFRMRQPAVAPAPQIEIKRITSLGKVISASISPDAKLVAYVVSDQGSQSLWLRQLATGRDLQLIPPDHVAYWSHTFTRDGSAIVYGVRNDTYRNGAFYEIPILGGPPRLISSDGMDSSPSFSPDGKRFVYYRAEFPSKGESAVVIANSDGSNIHPIASRKAPLKFAPVFFGAPAWSHDGTQIAAGENSSGTGASRIVLINPETGKEKELTRGWSFIGQLEWLADDSGVLAIATPATSRSNDAQIWLFPLSGAPRQVTRDLFGYRIVNLSADGKSLVSVATDGESTIWKGSLDGKTTPEALTSERLDGIAGLAVLPDGLLYTSLINGHLAIVRRSPGQMPDVLSGDEESRDPSAPADGKFFIYNTVTPGGVEVRRVELDGSRKRTLLLKSSDVQPADVSRDGKWVVVAGGRKLMRIPSAGGAPVILADGSFTLPVFSPDGSRIAAYELGDQGFRLLVMSAENGAVEWSRPIEPTRFGAALRWTPDGKALLINTMPRDRANIWLVPFQGEPQKLTSYTDKNAGPFVPLPDGKTIIHARQTNIRDAVLITNFR